jgi:hypothetical protein
LLALTAIAAVIVMLFMGGRITSILGSIGGKLQQLVAEVGYPARMLEPTLNKPREITSAAVDNTSFGNGWATRRNARSMFVIPTTLSAAGPNGPPGQETARVRPG